METEIIESKVISNLSEIKENTKLIPDLTNIVIDYILTPYQYQSLINTRKGCEFSEYLQFRDQYEINVAREIYQKYEEDAKVIYDIIMFQIGNDQQIPDKSEIENKYLSYFDILLEKYIQLLIIVLKDTNVFEISKFKNNDRYIITGSQLYEYFDVEYPNFTMSIKFNIEEIRFFDEDLRFQIKQKIANKGIVRSYGYSEIKLSPLWNTCVNILRDNHLWICKIKSALFSRMF